jgi:hypothetical protein
MTYKSFIQKDIINEENFSNRGYGATYSDSRTSPGNWQFGTNK